MPINLDNILALRKNKELINKTKYFYGIKVQNSYAQWLGQTDVDLKNKWNVGVGRYLKKAEENIKAVEKGMFGVKHINDL